LIVQFLAVACAVPGIRSAKPSRRGERLATEKGKLAETTDPLARAKSYTIIADLILSFATDAALAGASEDLRSLLSQYTAAIRSARDTLIESQHQGDRRPQGFRDLEGAIGRQLKSLEEIRAKVSAPDTDHVNQAIAFASTIRDEMARL
jgi:hypothetical protein